MDYYFEDEKLDNSAFVRLSKGQRTTIEAIAKENKVPVARVIRTFIQVGINDYKSSRQGQQATR